MNLVAAVYILLIVRSRTWYVMVRDSLLTGYDRLLRVSSRLAIYLRLRTRSVRVDMMMVRTINYSGGRLSVNCGLRNRTRTRTCVNMVMVWLVWLRRYTRSYRVRFGVYFLFQFANESHDLQ